MQFFNSKCKLKLQIIKNENYELIANYLNIMQEVIQGLNMILFRLFVFRHVQHETVFGSQNTHTFLLIISSMWKMSDIYTVYQIFQRNKKIKVNCYRYSQTSEQRPPRELDKVTEFWTSPIFRGSSF